MRTIAVVLAGGTGVRMSSALPKQLIEVAGKPLIEHTIAALHGSDLVDEVVVVMVAEHLEAVEAIVRDRYPKVRQVVAGGQTRSASTRAALAAISDTDGRVLLHDAARPLVDARIIADCVAALSAYDAVVATLPTTDTVLEVDDGAVVGVADRSRLERAQTPQGFRLSTIRRAYDLAARDAGFTATDDASVVARYLPATTIHVVAGSERNIKVTGPDDLLVVERLLAPGG